MSESADKLPPTVIARRVDYFEVGVFGICALYGTITLTSFQELAATSVKMYPGIGGVAFLAMLVVGGATGLISYAFKTIIGPKLELAGLTLLVLLCIAYSLWTPFSVGLRGIGLLLFMGVLIAIPGFFTCRRLSRYIDEVEAIEHYHRMGGEESENDADSDAMGSRRGRRRWWR